MRLYSGSSEQFIHDNIQNQIAEKLKIAFFNYFRFNPSPNEINSWKNSLRAISQVFQYAELTDHGVILEYQLPMTSKRLDCMVSGKDKEGKENAVIIELKQWDKCEDSAGENEVTTWVGGAKREVLHPSAQVRQYHLYLSDTHTAFYEGENPVNLNSCSYLHNYNHYEDDVIFADKFHPIIEFSPLFTADDVDDLRDFLVSKLEKGGGLDVLKKIEESKYRPSKKLMDHVGNVIKGKSEYILLDEQLIVYDKVLSCAKKGFHDKQKTILIIKGGPGTGKSVIAINLMADLLLRGFNAHYATGSKAFTETLRKIIGVRGSVQFRYFNSYTEAQPNEIDVLICDEAHRIRKNSQSRYTPKEKRTDMPQI
ncbi:MAG: DNA/RNA helicase domain-containing protein, partial [Candidatus Woesearchaeota archaeon]